MFFTKSDASIASARAAVRPPAHVKLLDYEIELALISRRSVSSDARVTADTLKDYVFAVAVANDLSARDVQLPQTQFFKGKSYRGFCPIGPWLTVLEPEEFACLERSANCSFRSTGGCARATRRRTWCSSLRRRFQS